MNVTCYRVSSRTRFHIDCSPTEQLVGVPSHIYHRDIVVGRIQLFFMLLFSPCPSFSAPSKYSADVDLASNGGLTLSRNKHTHKACKLSVGCICPLVMREDMSTWSAVQ